MPLLHESKKIIDRSNHKLLPSQSESTKQESNKDYLSSSWTRRSEEYELDKNRETREILEREWIREREREREKDSSERPPLSQQQEQVSQSQTYRMPRAEAQPSLPSPRQQQPHSQLSTPLPRLEIVEKTDSESERRNDEDKFSESPDKDSTFSPPDGKI